jgi:isochorismate hydrolase
MQPLSVLVIDVCEGWEEELKAHERGFFIDCNYLGIEKYEVAEWWNPEKVPHKLQYPYGSARAGFDAIVDTIRIAHEHKIPIYSVVKLGQWSDGDEDICNALKPYIAKENRFLKYGFSAFSCAELADRLQKEVDGELLVVGYDRDCCVLDTIKDAVARGMRAVTSEQCMLTMNTTGSRESSLSFYKERTKYLDSLVAVWNFIVQTTASV